VADRDLDGRADEAGHGARAAGVRPGGHHLARAQVGDRHEGQVGGAVLARPAKRVSAWRVAVKRRLARTFFRDAPLVILDEPTMALDAKAEHELFARIGELFSDRSVVLLISHPFSTVRSAGRIYVLNEGFVVESGDASGARGRWGTYAELFALQASPYQ
jgi:ATP-binding cassette, subfamily B, bacterial